MAAAVEEAAQTPSAAPAAVIRYHTCRVRYLVDGVDAAAPRRRRRDAIGATRAGRRAVGAPDGRRSSPAAPRPGPGYGSYLLHDVYSAATSRVKIHCVWW